MVINLTKRYLQPDVVSDLAEKMVFIGGPRQVGKTTFSLSLLKPFDLAHPAYLNWDSVKHRKQMQSGELPAHQRLVIFDEIHKYARWRNLVKGIYDTNHGRVALLVTGSARLDYYRRGGDSLQGRYHYYRLHPFSLPELTSKPTKKDVEQLLQFGGFPEPLLKGNTRFWQRWQRERQHRVIYEDLRDLEHVKEIDLLDLLANELPHRVGSPLSLKNLKEALEVSHQSIERWLLIFERLYFSFRLPPMSGRRIRAVKKEQKLYLWDWSLVPELGPRFENMVASHLLKYCHYIEDTQGHRMELRYIRDTDRREVDFVVLRAGRPVFAVECKTGEKQVSPAIQYFAQRMPIPTWYQVHLGTRDYLSHGIRILPWMTFCKEVQLV